MKYLFLLVLCCISQFTFAQNEIKGRVVDGHKMPIPNMKVSILNTNSQQNTDINGDFLITTDLNVGRIEFQHPDFQSVSRAFDFQDQKDIDLGEIILSIYSSELGEVVIIGKGLIDLERNRKTPTAVSTVNKEEIQLRNVGNVEFPNILRNTPSAYISSESGGFGDGKLFVRGFDQSNTAFLINGQPVNGMQNGQLYWSNWNGLTDIVSAVEVQRGLGSSKLAVSSAGGTVNLITKTTDKNRGGFIRGLSGNDSFIEGTLSYDTGMNDNGWGFSFLVDYWKAHANYAKGTKGEGQNYFFSVGKEMENHNFNLLLTGAPLIHDQNPSKSMGLYDRFGQKYNNQYGFRNGKYLPEKRKFYHKPIFNFNWDWEIDQDIKLSTVLYASFGHGGGTQTYGRDVSQIDYPQTANDDLLNGAYQPSNGLIDWDYVQDVYNSAIDEGFSRGNQGTTLTSTINNNQYYGGVGNFEYKKIKNLDLNVGVDFRYYRDKHFKQLIDKMGLEGRVEDFGGNPQHIVTKTFDANPWAVLFNRAGESYRVNYDYSESINYHGSFAQAEWANDKFSVFLQGAISNQSYRRVDRGNFENTKVSKRLYKVGYNLKTGASWKLNKNNIVFANVGKYSRQPFLTNIFTNFKDRTKIEDNSVSNEEIKGAEAGYTFKNQNLTINFNAYFTQWENRLLTTSGGYDPNDNLGNPQYPNATFYFTNIAQLHQGLELDFKWKVLTNLNLSGYATLGKWEYAGKTPVRIINENNQSVIAEKTTELKDTKVGQAPQTTTGAGIDYRFFNGKLNSYISWNYYTDFYGFVDVGEAAISTLNETTYQPEKLNSYSVVNLGLSYNLSIENHAFQLNGNVYNLFNQSYISQKDNSGYYFGNGTTFNISVKYLL